MVKFTDKEVASNFESLADVDRPVHKAGVYSGLLSNITPEMAKAMAAQNSNLVKEKPAAAVDTSGSGKPKPDNSKP